jgi:outer membrane receptor for ferrienterochelin and colicin
VRTLLLKQSLFIDADGYFNRYENFIAQVEASVPNTTDADSIPTYLYTKSNQSRYRLWTNSKSVIYSYGMSLGVKYVLKSNYNFSLNGTFTKLDRTAEKDGLEDGFNTPQWMVNGTIGAKRLWKQLGGSLTARYQSAFPYVSFLVSGEVAAFWTMDAQLNYQFRKPHINVKIGATNLLNTHYNNMLGGPSVGGFYYLSALWDVKM